jgi:hypothetical protein
MLTNSQDDGESMAVAINGKAVYVSKVIDETQGEIDGKAWTTISKISDCEEVVPVKKRGQDHT